MKTVILCVFFGYSIIVRVGAQSIEAHEVGTGDAVIHHWESRSGRSYGREYLQTKRLRVTVRDVTRRVREAEVLVYFVGRRLPSGDRFIYAHNKIPVVFHGHMEVTGDVPAPSVNLNRQTFAGETSSSGVEMDGWIVIGRVGSRVFDTRASSSSLLQRAGESSQEPDSLRAMMTAANIYDEPTSPQTSQTPANANSVHQPPKPAAVLSPSSSPLQFTTLVKPVRITLPSGEATLQPGVRFQVISRDVGSVQILYGTGTITIPISSTDLR
jgi:hypothetical protein